MGLSKTNPITVPLWMMMTREHSIEANFSIGEQIIKLRIFYLEQKRVKREKRLNFDEVYQLYRFDLAAGQERRHGF